MGTQYAYVCDSRREWFDANKRPYRPDRSAPVVFALWVGRWLKCSIRLISENDGDEFYRLHPRTRDDEIDAWSGKPGDQYKNVTVEMTSDWTDFETEQ